MSPSTAFSRLSRLLSSKGKKNLHPGTFAFSTRIPPPDLPQESCSFLAFTNPIMFPIAYRQYPKKGYEVFNITDRRLVIHGPRHTFVDDPNAPVTPPKDLPPNPDPAAPKPVRSFIRVYHVLPAFLLKSGLDLKKLMWIWPNLLSRPLHIDPVYHHAVLWSEQHDKHAHEECIVDYIIWAITTFEDFCEEDLPSFFPPPTAHDIKTGVSFSNEFELDNWHASKDGKGNYVMAIIFKKGYKGNKKGNRKGRENVFHINKEHIQISELWIPQDAGGQMIHGRIVLMGYPHHYSDRIRLF